MPYVPDLDQVQLGKEVTWGTAVNTTVKMGLIEECSIEPDLEVSNLPDIRGSLAGSFVQTLDSHKGAASVKGVATYEDFQYWLESLLGIATPSGAGPYVYALSGPTTAVPTRRMLTLVHGQTGAVRALAGGLVDDLTISIESNKSWKFDAKLLGKSVAAGTLQALSDRTQTPIHANVTSLYIDAVGGTVGSTLISSIWFSAELNIKANIGLAMGIGSLNPANYRDAAYVATLKLTLEVDATTGGYLTSILGTSVLQHQVRIKGTTGASQIAQIDFAGGHTKAAESGSDSDGVKTFEFEYTRNYNTTLGKWLATSITNSSATLA
jgi:hypothetical protein